MSSNDDVLVCRSYIDKSSEVFYLIGNIEENIYKLTLLFTSIEYTSNKDSVYADISYCFRDIARYLREIKKGLKE